MEWINYIFITAICIILFLAICLLIVDYLLYKYDTGSMVMETFNTDYLTFKDKLFDIILFMMASPLTLIIVVSWMLDRRR